MKDLIEKYRLVPTIGPLRMTVPQPITSLDEAIQSSEHLHIHANPIYGSYDKMFPLEKPLPEEFDAYIFSLGDRSEDDEIDTYEFIQDVLTSDSLLLVGIEGIILLANQHFQQLPGVVLAPAYSYRRSRIVNFSADEAQIPFCFNSEKSDSIGVGYSRFSAGSIVSDGINHLMIGVAVTIKKLFIPVGANLEMEQVNKLRTRYPFLTDQHIESIQYWSDPHSHYGGTIISENSQYACYPYDKNGAGFIQEFPAGIIWGE